MGTFCESRSGFLSWDLPWAFFRVILHRRTHKSKTQLSISKIMTAASFWTAIFCYLPVGVVSLVFAAFDRTTENDEATSCGQEGSRPPIRDWLWGTGIAFVIMAGAALMVSSCFTTTEDRGIFGIVSGCSPCFILAWAIVGTISLAGDGKHCEEEDPMLWKVALLGMANTAKRLIFLPVVAVLR